MIDQTSVALAWIFWRYICSLRMYFTQRLLYLVDSSYLNTDFGIEMSILA